MGPLRIVQVPANDFGDVIDIAACDREAERVLEREAGLSPHPNGQIGKGLTDRMQVSLALDSTNRESMAARLCHVDMNGNLAQAAFHDQPLEKVRLFDQRLAVGHQHGDRPDGEKHNE